MKKGRINIIYTLLNTCLYSTSHKGGPNIAQEGDTLIAATADFSSPFHHSRVPLPVPPCSHRPHRPRWQVPGPLLPCHRPLAPHPPGPSCYDTPPSASEINYLGCPDFSVRWLRVWVPAGWPTPLLRAALTATTLLLLGALSPPQKWPKPMAGLTRRQGLHPSLLQVLHFKQRYKQACPPSYGFASSANTRNN